MASGLYPSSIDSASDRRLWGFKEMKPGLTFA